MPILDIIIPQYKEGEAEIRNLLESIDMQCGVNRADFKITIVNDHSDKKLSIDFLKLFNLNINYLMLDENVGSGMARQVGIDNTEAPYIMFMDADDSFFRADALNIILKVVQAPEQQANEWSMIQTNFYEENFQQGFQLIEHKGYNMIFLHGKVFNRAYLRKYDIRFKPGLRTFEDTYFCKTCTLSGPTGNAKTLDVFTYVWKRAEGSISSSWNHDGRSYMYWRIDDYIGCNEGALDFFREHFKEKPIERMVELVYHTLVYTYLNYHTADFAGEDELTVTNRQKLLDMSRRVALNNAAYMKEVPEALKESLHTECLSQMAATKATLSEFRPSFNAFLKDTLRLPDDVIKPLLYTPKPKPEENAQQTDETAVETQQKQG